MKIKIEKIIKHYENKISDLNKTMNILQRKGIYPEQCLAKIEEILDFIQIIKNLDEKPVSDKDLIDFNNYMARYQNDIPGEVKTAWNNLFEKSINSAKRIRH